LSYCSTETAIFFEFFVVNCLPEKQGFARLFYGKEKNLPDKSLNPVRILSGSVALGGCLP
jgi:hypothetical protein